MRDAASRLLASWNRMRVLPGGRWLFSRMVGRVAPYSGSIRPDVLELSPGFARVAMRERRRLRNPFASIHAAALTNLGELTSGLAVWTAMPDDLRGIITSLHVRFDKKARGRLVAESRVTLPAVHGPTDADAVATLRDAGGDTVAEVRVVWRLDRLP